MDDLHTKFIQQRRLQHKSNRGPREPNDPKTANPVGHANANSWDRAQSDVKANHADDLPTSEDERLNSLHDGPIIMKRSSTQRSNPRKNYNNPDLMSISGRDTSADSLRNHAESPVRLQISQQSGAIDSPMPISQLSLEHNQTPDETQSAPLHPRQVHESSSPSKKRPASSDHRHQEANVPFRHGPDQRTTSQFGKDAAPGPDFDSRLYAGEHARPRTSAKKLYDPSDPNPKSAFRTLNDQVFAQESHAGAIPASDKPPPRQNKQASTGRQEQHRDHQNKKLENLPTYMEESPTCVKQPDACPILPAQLAAEVGGIYAGLELVEARCIDEDRKLMGRRDHIVQPPTPIEWQTLTKLHRTLLYEHHDFLLASQHPVASDKLKRLASERQMPLRMWKWAIHAFLEILRQHLPASLDTMINFVYLSYQMMALLYETVPLFEDVWTECLGDLARYRMAIENHDMKDREVWGGVARYWYSKASDRQPLIGRLYHHLGILARPYVVQQLYFYGKSLTCASPFWNARESIKTIFAPALSQGPTKIDKSDIFEAAFVKAHAVMYAGRSVEECTDARNECLAVLDDHIARLGTKWKEQGGYMAVANTSPWIRYVDDQSPLRVLFSYATSVTVKPKDVEKTVKEVPTSLQPWLESAAEFTFGMLKVVLRRVGDKNILQHVHVVLAFLKSLTAVNQTQNITKMIGSILDVAPWVELASFLNRLYQFEGLSNRILQAASKNRFLRPDRGDAEPLPEDYLMRGLLWSGNFFPKDWFTKVVDEESRTIEMASSNKLRAERIFWLAITISQRTSCISFDTNQKTFSTSSGMGF